LPRPGVQPAGGRSGRSKVLGVVGPNPRRDAARVPEGVRAGDRRAGPVES